MKTPEGYEPLAAVLQEAIDQAAKGKGKERHQQNDRPFLRQPICEIPRMVGPAGSAYQVMKKTQEAMRLPADRAIVELLGAINYAAATIIVIRENEAERARPVVSVETETISLGELAGTITVRKTKAVELDDFDDLG